MKNYGKALKTLRKKSNMTQAQLAERLNVTYQTVSKWENSVNTPDIAAMEKLCAVFDVTADEFLRLAETDEQAPERDQAPMYCPRCGNKLIARYCGKCGYDTLAAPPVTDAERAEYVQAPEQGSATLAPEAAAAVKSKRKIKPAIIVLVSVLAAVILITAIVLPIVLLGKPHAPGKRYTVCFDAGGGSGVMLDIETNADASVTLPACKFVRTGYTFDGWEYDGRTYAAGDTVKVRASEDTATFAAKWSAVTYTVDFSYDGQTLVQTHSYGTSYVLPTAKYERTGYEHSGWKINGKTYAVGSIVTSLSSTAGATVKATPVFSPIKYFMEVDLGGMRSVVFGDEEYTGVSSFRVECEYGVDPLSSSLDKHVYAGGYEFLGYTLYDANGERYYGYPSYINADPDGVPRAVMNWMSGSYDILLYYFKDAVVEICTMGGCRGTEEYPLPLASEVFENRPNIGYTFKRWVQDLYDGKPSIFFEDGATVSNLKMNELATANDSYYVKLYAEWEPITYTVEFDGGGGIGEMSALDIEYDESMALPRNAFVKDGYIFAGWRCGDEYYQDGDRIKNLTARPESLTFVAQWVKGYDGDGTEESPYIISDYAELESFSRATRLVEGMDGAHYLLANDIDCEGRELEAAFGRSGRFFGVFDGGGHEIKNAVFAATDGYGYTNGYRYKGLFGEVGGGVIKNVGIVGYKIVGTENCAFISPLCGKYSSSMPLVGCYAEGSIELENVETSRVAGLVAILRSGAENCYAAGDIKIKYTKASGEIYVRDFYVGGFTTSQTSDSGTIRNCYAAVDMDFDIAPEIPNIVERLYCGLFTAYGGRITDCFATGSLHSNRYFDNNGNPMIFDYIGNFCGFFHSSYVIIENVYVDANSKIEFDDYAEFAQAPGGGNAPTTGGDNLRSLDWLVENLHFDASVWTVTDGKLRLIKN